MTIEEIWRRYDDVEARLTAPVSERMLDLAELAPGMRVLDLATGRGEPAVRAARRVGPAGRVLGVDQSEALLRLARERADREGITNLDLRAANAERADGIPAGAFHAVTIRWGLMYMDAPAAALANARRALLPDGKGTLVAALWAEPERVPYFALTRRLLAHYRPLPALDPEAPGMFRYASPERIARDFTQAGFTIDHVEEMDIPLFEAETAAEVVGWARALGSGLGKLVSELPDDDQREWEHALADELEKTRAGDVIRAGGWTRIVRARPRSSGEQTVLARGQQST